MPNQIEDAINEMIQSMYRQKLHCHVNQSVSTNSELLTQIGNGELDSTQLHALTADVQTGGRGQHGRSWQSPKGNVYLSLYYPVCHASFPLVQPISGLLSLCVGYELSQLSVIERLNKRLKYPIGVKWANDIGFYQDTFLEPSDKACESFKSHPHIQFRKLSGILIEPVMKQGKMLGVIVGVGLNVATAPNLSTLAQEGMNYQTVSLLDLLNGKENIQPKELYRPIFIAIIKAILTHQQVSKAGNKDELSRFLDDFAKVDLLKNRQLLVKADGLSAEPNSMLTGTAVGIDKQGCLLLQDDDGKVTPLFSGKVEVVL